jgi:hypothetical protein
MFASQSEFNKDKIGTDENEIESINTSLKNSLNVDFDKKPTALNAKNIILNSLTKHNLELVSSVIERVR